MISTDSAWPVVPGADDLVVGRHCVAAGVAGDRSRHALQIDSKTACMPQKQPPARTTRLRFEPRRRERAEQAECERERARSVRMRFIYPITLCGGEMDDWRLRAGARRAKPARSA